MAFLFQSMTPALMNANALIAFTAATLLSPQDPPQTIFFQGRNSHGDNALKQLQVLGADFLDFLMRREAQGAT